VFFQPFLEDLLQKHLAMRQHLTAKLKRGYFQDLAHFSFVFL
jgi:hypothetical protein